MKARCRFISYKCIYTETLAKLTSSDHLKLPFKIFPLFKMKERHFDQKLSNFLVKVAL